MCRARRPEPEVVRPGDLPTEAERGGAAAAYRVASSQVGSGAGRAATKASYETVRPPIRYSLGAEVDAGREPTRKHPYSLCRPGGFTRLRSTAAGAVVSGRQDADDGSLSVPRPSDSLRDRFEETL